MLLWVLASSMFKEGKRKKEGRVWARRLDSLISMERPGGWAWGDGAVGGGMASGCPWSPGLARRVAHLKLGSLASLVRRVETGVEQWLGGRSGGKGGVCGCVE